MLSKWPVLLTLPVGNEDRDDEGVLTEDAIGQLFARARRVYLADCSTIDEPTVEILQLAVQPGPGRASADEVSVSVSVVEVYDDRFTMNARIRGGDDGAVVASAWCALSPGGEVTKAMRDEFIALAHAASHYN